jgi:hypothetical protein
MTNDFYCLLLINFVFYFSCYFFLIFFLFLYLLKLVVHADEEVSAWRGVIVTHSGATGVS